MRGDFFLVDQVLFGGSKRLFDVGLMGSFGPALDGDDCAWSTEEGGWDQGIRRLRTHRRPSGTGDLNLGWIVGWTVQMVGHRATSIAGLGRPLWCALPPPTAVTGSLRQPGAVPVDIECHLTDLPEYRRR